MFVKRPRVMLLDEPFNGLDHFGSKNLKELLQKYLRREDAIIIIVSHTGLEDDFVDRVVRLN